ncbi:IS4 family transposase [Aequorivita marina]|uniref:IS4 family transposase n=1 Tax=Aequorivita marina TaxID=3073654 RepID=UPI002875EE65|nr:IS4 family transposase [Aequorivita sp. S2608]MDS1297902.1 IS4 family transposase [Aequorivita sp. S2608]
MGLFKRTKNTDTPLIRQILNLVPSWMLARCAEQYKSDKGCSRYKTLDQFVALTFGQLNKCLTLSDISTGIGVSEAFISSLGLGQSPARSTMSDGNRKRSYKVFETLYHRLLTHYEAILSKRHQSHIIKEIKDRNIKLIDSTVISLCLAMFDWAKFRTAKGGIKIHTCWDDTMMIPDVVNITQAKLHDRHGLEQLVFPKGTVVVEDRAYFDFHLMLQREIAENVFVTRIKTNTVFETVRELELPENCDQDILKDEIIILSSKKAVETGISEVPLRLVHVYKADENKVIEIITNQLDWTARTIADLYKKRWDIELFFKAIKQNLQIKTFVGTSENAVKSQIYIALITYLLLQLILRTIARKKHAFSNFVEKIRICLTFYLTLDYVCNQVGEGAKRIRGKPQQELRFKTDLFS